MVVVVVVVMVMIVAMVNTLDLIHSLGGRHGLALVLVQSGLLVVAVRDRRRAYIHTHIHRCTDIWVEG